MNRRALMKGLIVGGLISASQKSFACMIGDYIEESEEIGFFSNISDTSINGSSSIEEIDTVSKIDKTPEDVILTGTKRQLLSSVTNRLRRVRTNVGHTNFCLLSLDEALLYARRYPTIGKFPDAEIEFLEQIFYTNAEDYGFYGDKITQEITAKINHNDIVKIPHTGNYLFQQSSVKLYERIRRDVGKSIVLTSGVRGVVKQMYLFLAKVDRNKGNLSLASRSLAPPGHSFHATGDFDVGKVGFGYRNFSSEFAKTDEYQRLNKLEYISIRYHKNNSMGVRFEPWHIKADV